ncbi:hypothetical protein [Niastella sp. OAS944]|uniref:hypothetical protein n=1 Tax=Niastella sp. OAS944 TaxID=2664089 RepID=UPI0034798B27|nr:hypothetical protein [Chitinophagaceae bacterium OAS944]
MEHKNKLITLLCAIISITSCKKYKIESYSLTSLTAVNAVVGGVGMKIGSRAVTIGNNNFAQISLFQGSNDLYFWPVADSLHPYFSDSKFVTEDREIYSLFVCGQAGSTEGVIIKEDIPYRTDSTAGIRFINLSPNSTPLNITLSTTPTINEVSNLAYKQYTEFKTYPGFYNSAYTFQIRDASAASPSAPLATFSLTTSTVPRFSNVTLVIRGLVGTTPALGVTRVNNDR